MPSGDVIRLLPDSVANQIAAGEVILPYRSKYFLEKEIRENIVPYSVLELVLFRL